MGLTEDDAERLKEMLNDLLDAQQEELEPPDEELLQLLKEVIELVESEVPAAKLRDDPEWLGLLGKVADLEDE